MGYHKKCIYCGSAVKVQYEGQKAICDSCRSEVLHRVNKSLDKIAKVF